LKTLKAISVVEILPDGGHGKFANSPAFKTLGYSQFCPAGLTFSTMLLAVCAANEVALR
jgi:hypothetical protein